MAQRNFIPGLTKRQSYYASVGFAAVAGAGLYFLLRPKYRFRSIYDWDDSDITVLQGHPFSVRVPRGQGFIVASPDVIVKSQADFANETHLSLVSLPIVRKPYNLQTSIIEEISGDTYPIRFVAVPMSMFALPAQEAISEERR